MAIAPPMSVDRISERPALRVPSPDACWPIDATLIMTGRCAALALDNRNQSTTGSVITIERYAFQRAVGSAGVGGCGRAGISGTSALPSGNSACAIQTKMIPTIVPIVTPSSTANTASMLTEPIAVLIAIPTVANVPRTALPPLATK